MTGMPVAGDRVSVTWPSPPIGSDTNGDSEQ